jgi:hypothetical protein
MHLTYQMNWIPSIKMLSTGWHWQERSHLMWSIVLQLIPGFHTDFYKIFQTPEMMRSYVLVAESVRSVHVQGTITGVPNQEIQHKTMLSLFLYVSDFSGPIFKSSSKLRVFIFYNSSDIFQCLVWLWKPWISTGSCSCTRIHLKHRVIHMIHREKKRCMPILNDILNLPIWWALGVSRYSCWLVQWCGLKCWISSAHRELLTLSMQTVMHRIILVIDKGFRV